MAHEYTIPVSKLLTDGECKLTGKDGWPDYRELGFTQDHVEELIRMATDEELHYADQESLEVWAPVHAWRTLAQLRVAEAVVPLIELLKLNADEDEDWTSNELPVVFGAIGPEALPALTAALKEEGNVSNDDEIGFAVSMNSSIEEVGKQHPDARHESIAILSEFLKDYRHHNPELNAFIVWSLVDLEAAEALPLIREVFEREYADYTIVGDVEDVEMALGVRKKRETSEDRPAPRDKYPGFDSRLNGVFGRNENNEKLGRNDRCPCGSGKKYKKCCLGHPDGVMMHDYLAMFSKQKLDIRWKQKAELISMVLAGRQEEAVNTLKQMTGADTRLIHDYVKRLASYR
jgi:hypothetical protein